MDQFVALTGAGLAQGSIAALIVLGVVLLHNATGIVNFAQGDLLTLGGFLGFWLVHDHGWAWFPAYVVVLLAVFAVGVGIERVGYAPLRKQPQTAVMISTFALALGMRSLIVLQFDSTSRSLPSPIGEHVVHLWGGAIPGQTFVVLAVTAVLFIAMMIVLHRTSIGRQLRALAVDRDTALLQGIRVDRLTIVVFGLSAALAALGGLLGASVLPLGPDAGFALLLTSFSAVVIGGFDRIDAAVAAAFGVQLAVVYLTGYVSPDYVEAYPFMILLGMLIVKPHGVVKGLAGVRY